MKMADYINPLTFETEVPEGWRKIQELQERAPEFISERSYAVEMKAHERYHVEAVELVAGNIDILVEFVIEV